MGTSEKKQVLQQQEVSLHSHRNVFDEDRILGAGEDIKMVYYQQLEECEKAYLTLHSNLLAFVLQGQKQIFHERGKITILPTEGFFLQQGSYLRTERIADKFHGYQTLVIFLSDKLLQSVQDTREKEEQVSLEGTAGKVHPGQDERPPTGQSGNDQNAGQEDMAFKVQTDPLIQHLVQQLVQYFQMPAEKGRINAILPLKIRELLFLLGSLPGNKGFTARISQLPSVRERELQVLMETHFRESLTQEQWAFLAGLSLSSFKRKFEAQFHQSPGKWIQQRRLKEAYQLLSDTRMNVTEVCYEVGFENLAHFVHAFREQYQITPKQRQLAGSQGSQLQPG